jgi:hypothetical protein
MTEPVSDAEPNKEIIYRERLQKLSFLITGNDNRFLSDDPRIEEKLKSYVERVYESDAEMTAEQLAVQIVNKFTRLGLKGNIIEWEVIEDEIQAELEAYASYWKQRALAAEAKLPCGKEQRIKAHLLALVKRELSARQDALLRAKSDYARGYMQADELADYENDLAFERQVLRSLQ